MRKTNLWHICKYVFVQIKLNEKVISEQAKFPNFQKFCNRYRFTFQSDQHITDVT